jgi:hypothetical protein
MLRRTGEGNFISFMCGRLAVLRLLPDILRHRRLLAQTHPARDAAGWHIQETYPLGFAPTRSARARAPGWSSGYGASSSAARTGQGLYLDLNLSGARARARSHCAQVTSIGSCPRPPLILAAGTNEDTPAR